MKKLLARRGSRLAAVAVLGLVVTFLSGLAAHEGQWPLSMIDRLDLKALGLEIGAKEIWNPEAPSLVDAVCRVGGGTGSFVSADGLILTNHHVAFDAVQAVSTPEQDRLTNGFAAMTADEELPAKNYVCRITTGYRDVSAEMIAATTGVPPEARFQALSLKARELSEAAEAQNPGTKADVSEMFQGSSWFLFLYQDIPDVRLVCVPPRAVGEYGGEDDNWIWPRHNGDFSFLRAYVGPDGKPRPYSPDNVPFHPKRFLPVEAKGLKDGDAVFLLGYPGRTFRHQTSGYLEYEEKYRLPFTADYLRERIAFMNRLSAGDPAVALALAPDIKGFANVQKNFDGKLLGLRRLGLVEKKRAEEAELQDWLEADGARLKKWGDFLPAIQAIFDEMLAEGSDPLLLRQLVTAPVGMQLASDMIVGRNAMKQPVEKRPPLWRDDQAAARAERHHRRVAELNLDVETHLFEILFRRADERAAQTDRKSNNPWIEVYQLFRSTFGRDNDPAAFARELVHESKLYDLAGFEALLHAPETGDGAFADRLSALLQGLAPGYAMAQADAARRLGTLNGLLANYVDAKQVFRPADFFPDANGTLRLTTGRVRGYTPRDGISYRPFTTLHGVVEKHRGRDPFDAPAELIAKERERDFGNFADPALDDVPVAFIYDTDTTGGNSGSPVMNARGALVGVNFDRCYEATINDYQWSSDYSRSIGVDLRYVLWVTQKLMKADRVLAEMGLR